MRASPHRRERAQALVEAVVALPVCIACALALVDAGVLVRDRIAVAQAAARGAEAEVAGADARRAILRALPEARRASARVRVDVRAGTVRVEIDGGSRIARIAGQRVRLGSSSSFA